MGKYAVLLSGGVNDRFNFPRYQNDLELVYKVLLEDCEYDRENIRFFANGKPLTYRSEEIATKEANREEIFSCLTAMTNTLTEEDSYALIMSNHGGEDKGGCIHLWGREQLELSVLGEALNRIRAKKNIILGECYAGNILSMNISNACVVTANEAGKVSYAHPDKNEYDELIFHFFSFIHKKYPDGENILRGENNVIKAYEYALAKDSFHPGNNFCRRNICPGIKIEEIPQIKCNILGTVRL